MRTYSYSAVLLIHTKMNIIAKIFSKKTKKATPTTTKTIDELRDMEETLVEKQAHLESKIDQEMLNARKYNTKNKRAAIQALKRKKRFEKELQQIDRTLSTLEIQRETLESATINSAVLITMKSAADSMKVKHEQRQVNDIHDMMDEIGLQLNLSKEISDAISNPFGCEIDEIDLEKELEELEEGKRNKITSPFPDTPSEELIILEKQRKKEFRRQQENLQTS